MTAYTIVAPRCCRLDKLLSDIHHIYLEIRALPQPFRQVASARNNKAVALLKRESAPVAAKHRMTAIAPGMAQVTRKAFFAHPTQRVVNNYILYDIHRGNKNT